MTRLTIDRATQGYSSLAALLLSATLAACGGGAGGGKGAQAPTTEAATEGAPAAQAPTPAGGQFAVSDAPTSGDSSQNRPKMNATAQAAYNAGMEAFKKGDLAGAKNQFSQATQADPKAYQPSTPSAWCVSVRMKRRARSRLIVKQPRWSPITSRRSSRTPFSWRARASPMTPWIS